MPINAEDPIMSDAIDPADRVVVSTGHQFDINTLIHWHNTRGYTGGALSAVTPLGGETPNSKWLRNPATNSVFSEKDVAHIQAFCAQKGIAIESLKVAGQQQPAQAVPVPMPLPQQAQQHHAFFQPAQGVWTRSIHVYHMTGTYDFINRALVYIRSIEITTDGYRNSYSILLSQASEHNALLSDALNQRGIHAAFPGVISFPNPQAAYQGTLLMRGSIDDIRQIIDQVLAAVESLEGPSAAFNTVRETITSALNHIQAAPPAPQLVA